MVDVDLTVMETANVMEIVIKEMGNHFFFSLKSKNMTRIHLIDRGGIMNEILIRQYIEELRYDELYDYVQSLIEHNDADALCLMGDMYYFNIGVDEDLEKAIEYYQKAYKQNNRLAKDRLGEIYYQKAEYIYKYASYLFEREPQDYIKACAALKYAYATYKKSADYHYIKAYRSLEMNFINYSKDDYS